MNHTVVEMNIRGIDVENAKIILEGVKKLDFLKEFDRIWRQKDLVRIRLDRNDAMYLLNKIVTISNKFEKNSDKIDEVIETIDENEQYDFISSIKTFNIWASIDVDFKN